MSTPSSARRFSTPLEPTMLVFTAPARIRKPTMTTNDRISDLKPVRADEILARPLMRLSR